MWWQQLYRRSVNRPHTPRHRCARLSLECLEDRLTPSNFAAAAVSDLIADIKAANLAGGPNTITLAPNVTFDLTAADNTIDGATGLPVIAANNNLTVTGQGGDILQRDAAAPAFRLLDVGSGASLTLQNLTLQNGYAFGSGVSAEGGGIYNQGTLVLNGVTVQSNSAVGSSGVTLSNGNGSNGNSAAGGGIYSSGTLTLATGTLVNGNQALGGAGGDGFYKGNGGNGGNGFGGGLYIGGGTVYLTSAGLSGDRAVGGWGGSGGKSDSFWLGYLGSGGNGGNGFGGGLYIGTGTATLTGDLLENNSAAGGAGGNGGGNGKSYSYLGLPGDGSGGGLYAAAGSISMVNDTVQSNSANNTGGGLYIVSKAKVCLDAYTLANVIGNTAFSYPNIDGSYQIC